MCVCVCVCAYCQYYPVHDWIKSIFGIEVSLIESEKRGLS